MNEIVGLSIGIIIGSIIGSVFVIGIRCIVEYMIL